MWDWLNRFRDFLWGLDKNKRERVDPTTSKEIIEWLWSENDVWWEELFPVGKEVSETEFKKYKFMWGQPFLANDGKKLVVISNSYEVDFDRACSFLENIEKHTLSIEKENIIINRYESNKNDFFTYKECYIEISKYLRPIMWNQVWTTSDLASDPSLVISGLRLLIVCLNFRTPAEFYSYAKEKYKKSEVLRWVFDIIMKYDTSISIHNGVFNQEPVVKIKKI